jgi:predicted thioesterase/predicted N-acetyltransferase YhbS
MEIRPARPEEYDAAGELTVTAYVGGGHLSADHRYAATLRDAAARAEEAVLLVAVEDDRVLGTVTYCPHGSPWRELGRDDEGEFRTLAVDPAAQGRGVGAALVRECIARSRADGDRGMVLCSLADQTTAHRIYSRLGFVRDPERDWWPSPDDRLLAFALTHPPAPEDRMEGLTFTVTDADTAEAIGSGSLPVLGTPRLLAWCEAATCAVLAPGLEPGTTSVGTEVALEHRAASPVGETLEVRAVLTESEGRLRRFDVEARRPDGTVVGAGRVVRAVVDAERFLDRVRT